MKLRRTSWLATGLFAIAMVEFIVALGLPIIDSPLLEVLGSEQFFFLVAFGSVAPVGLILAIHRPRNPIGWIFLVASIAQMSIAVTDSYATYTAGQQAGTPPELLALFWLTNWTWSVAFFPPFTFGLLLFPTGRLPSRRWRIFAWIGGSLLLVLALAAIVRPGPLELPPGWHEEISNPTGIDALKFPAETAWAVAGALVLMFTLGSAASLFVRLRRATARERQQLKWLAYAASIPVASFFISAVEDMTTSTNVGWLILVVGLVVQPIAIGIAILRHNLFDIDRLINRTLVYGSLTAALIGGFAGSVILFQLILSPLTQGNDLAVAVSTLFVFALFRPLRDRLQRFVDRRFYRQKYDTRRIVEDFALATRDAVDIDQLAVELTTVVTQTMQPRRIALWLPSGQSMANKR